MVALKRMPLMNGPLLGQPLQRGPDEQQLDGLSGDCDGDVPQPGFFDHGCPQ